VLTGRTVRELHRTTTGWRVVVGPTVEPEAIEADAVILACPAAPASRLLGAAVPAAAAGLAGLEYASVAVVTMIFDDPAVRSRLHGSGFLVPAVEGRLVKAATYLTEKWSWLGSLAGDRVVVRASVGRHREIEAVQRNPDDLARAVAADVAELAGTPARASSWHVTKWGGGLPQYAVGHVERVAEVRRAVAAVPGLAVCGAAYDGVGVAACIASAHAAADQVTRHLEAAPTMER
jgi:oxygen-dependent protoporphyrinogen oxidase